MSSPRKKRKSMSNNLEVAFPRYTALVQHLGLTLIKEFKEFAPGNVQKHENYEVFHEYAISREDYGVHSELVREVLSIEYEKIKLKDNPDTIRKISKYEKKWNEKRDEIFSLSIIDFMGLTLTASPLAKTYESNWEIVSVYPSSSYVTTNVSKEKNDFYFLFQRIGILDRLSQNNIVEYPLDRFEYVIFELFENSKSVSSALGEFVLLFDCDAPDERKEIEKRYLKIVKSAVFRKFLILSQDKVGFHNDSL